LTQNLLETLKKLGTATRAQGCGEAARVEAEHLFAAALESSSTSAPAVRTARWAEAEADRLRGCLVPRWSRAPSAAIVGQRRGVCAALDPEAPDERALVRARPATDRPRR
jgi:hypothetical protein